MTLAHPAWLWTLPVLLAVVAVTEGRVAGGTARRWARTAVRFSLLALLVLALAGPVLPDQRPADLRVVVAVDRSTSLAGEAARREALAVVQQAAQEAYAAGAHLTLLGFAEEAAAPYPGPGPGDPWPGAPAAPWPDAASDAPASPVPPVPPASPVPEPPPARIGQAALGLAAARLAFAPDERGGVLLVTSGRKGSLDGLAEAAAGLASDGIALRAVALPREAPARPSAARVEALDLPDRARGPFDVVARLHADTTLTATLLVDGSEVARQELPGHGTRELTLRDVTLAPGAHEVSLVLRSAGEGAPTTLVRRIVYVDRPPRVLAVVEDPERSPAYRAATAQGFAFEHGRPEDVAMALGADGAAGAIDAVLLDPGAAALIPLPVQEALAARVREGLGLFLEAGTSEEAWAALADGPLGPVLPLRPLPPPRGPPAARARAPRPLRKMRSRPSSPPHRRRPRASGPSGSPRRPCPSRSSSSSTAAARWRAESSPWPSRRRAARPAPSRRSTGWA